MKKSASAAAVAEESSAEDSAALKKAFDELYVDLKRIAEGYMRREKAHHTLRATDLVHEAFVQLAKAKPARWESERNFLALAARVMRHVLVNHAVKKGAHKRGGDALRVTFNENLAAHDPDAVDLLTLDRLLRELEQRDPRQVQVVELRYFAGMEIEEIAQVMGSSPSTVKRTWNSARLWLFRELEKNEKD